MKIRIVALCALLAVLSTGVSLAQQAPAVTAIKAGRLIDPETGTSAAGQVILIDGEGSPPWERAWQFRPGPL